LAIALPLLFVIVSLFVFVVAALAIFAACLAPYVWIRINLFWHPTLNVFVRELVEILGGLLCLPLFLILGWLMSMLAKPLNYFFGPIYDYLGDVAQYVGRRSEREKLQQHLAEILTGLAARAPNASIVIASHSLGTVLAAQTLIAIRHEIGLHRRITLITMGSPIRLMSRLCGRVIETPAEILCKLQQERVVNGWYNFWRNGDFVGRRLFQSTLAEISEKSVGSGGHTNYWGDARVWRELARLPIYGDGQSA
jgi:hypothetical protein